MTEGTTRGRWTKGESGNPKGKPVGSGELQKLRADSRASRDLAASASIANLAAPDASKPTIEGLVLSPSATSSVVVRNYNARSEMDFIDLAQQVEALQAKLKGGSLETVEAMLLGQALALQSMFVDLAVRAKNQTEISQLQCVTGLALRAQNGCRATLQTLAEVKFPRQAVFAKQANIANGPQQVNNGAAAPAPAKDVTPSNELLELPDARMDSGTQGEAGGADTWLATVEAINRATVSRGQGDRRNEQPKARRAVRAGN